MDATSIVRPVIWPRVDSPVGSQLARAVLTTLFALMALGALVVCTRRVSGTLHGSLSAAVLVGMAIVLGCSAIVFRGRVAAPADGMRPMIRYILCAAPSLVLALWAVALLLPDTSVVGVVGFVGLLLAEEGWSWGRMFPTSRRADQPSGARRLDAGTRTAIDEPADGGGVLDQTDAPGEGAMQRMVRRREPDGEQSIEGWVRAEFAPGQRHAMAHLAICPPLERTPQCYAEQSDGPPAQVKIGQVLPYGVRFEIKLDEPASEASEVTVEFSIQERPAE